MNAETRQIRYGVAGLGWFAQIAILPAFDHARRNSSLAALISGDPTKLTELGERHGVSGRFHYDEMEEAIRRERLDAVYIVVPNHRHRELAERAARAGAHVLCEKPLAVTEEECLTIRRACADAGVKLMVAYRLHFEEANLRALEIVRSGRIGEPRLIEATFCNRITDRDNIRLGPVERGGGPLHDIGIYCINAARHLFDDEPQEVVALTAHGADERFAASGEMVGAVLRFPGDRLAILGVSLSAADHDAFTVLGTAGRLRVEPAFQLSGNFRYRVKVGDQEEGSELPERDQIAPELLYFSDCILEDREPEPGGAEGLADVRVIAGLLRSATEGRAVRLAPVDVGERPDREQEAHRPPVAHQDLIHADSPADDD